MEMCFVPTPTLLVKALKIKMLFNSTLINRQGPWRPRLVSASRSQRGSLLRFCLMDSVKNGFKKMTTCETKPLTHDVKSTEC